MNGQLFLQVSIFLSQTISTFKVFSERKKIKVGLKRVAFFGLLWGIPGSHGGNRVERDF